MAREAVGRQLYNDAVKGNVTVLRELLEQDPYIIDTVSFACSRNLLHIATMNQQLGFVKEVLENTPQQARDLDSRKSSALHFAAAQGNLPITKELLTIAPEMCWSRDCQGMNPIHIAAIKGHVEIVRELVNKNYLPAALERVHRGQTVLHLCVKHGQIGALEVLVRELGELVCAKDDDGETLLHWAARLKQVEIIQYLVNTQIQKQSTNSMGKTALDILKESPQPQDPASQERATQMRELLMDSDPLQIPKEKLIFFNKRSDAIMMVAILIATMAFDAVISPPGGVWQDDSLQHTAGHAVMAYMHPTLYKFFYQSNMIAFVSSVLAIFLTATQLATKASIISVAVYYNMMVSLLAICFSYGASIIAMTPSIKMPFAHLVVHIFLGVIVSFTGSLLLWLFYRFGARVRSFIGTLVGFV